MSQVRNEDRKPFVESNISQFNAPLNTRSESMRASTVQRKIHVQSCVESQIFPQLFQVKWRVESTWHFIRELLSFGWWFFLQVVMKSSIIWTLLYAREIIRWTHFPYTVSLAQKVRLVIDFTGAQVLISGQSSPWPQHLPNVRNSHKTVTISRNQWWKINV